VDADRLRFPMKKTEDGFKEISWEAAFEFTVTKIQAIQGKYGNNSVGVHL